MSDVPVFQRRGYSANAVQTHLASDITTGSGALSVTPGEGATYPAASFFIIIEPGAANEDVVFVTSRTGDTFNGLIDLDYDHSSGATIWHGIFAPDIDEPNALVATYQAKGDLATRGDADGPQRLPVGSNGLPLVADSASPLGITYKQIGPGALAALSQLGAMFAAGASGVVGELAPGDPLTVLQRSSTAPLGVQWTDIGLGAWVDWAPVFAQGVTPAQNLVVARWTKIGRTVLAIVHVNFTSAGTSGGIITMTLPVAAYHLQMVGGGMTYFSAGFGMRGAKVQGSTTTSVTFAVDTQTVTGTNLGQQPAFAIANGDFAHVDLIMEASA